MMHFGDWVVKGYYIFSFETVVARRVGSLGWFQPVEMQEIRLAGG